jgi:all-trans-8'-apo-beta-carotenal 15,15'-oxygenase
MLTSTTSPAPTTAPRTAPPDDRGALSARLLSRSITREHGFEPLRVEGTLPAELRGALVRNGPGLFGQFGRAYPHSFEGDGLITAVRIADGAATGACRVTASAGLVAERAAGKVLFGTGLPWHRRFANAMRGRQKNTANTNVVAWQGRVLALMEAARPTELRLDRDDITTIGETDLGGVVGTAMSAHPHRVAARATTYNFGVEYGRHTRLVVYALPDDGVATRLTEVPLPFAPMLHDFVATERHLVWFLSPSVVRVPRMLLQLGDFNSLFGWRPELGTQVIVVPIDDPARVVQFTVDAFYQWHFANAFERGDEVVVDYVRYPDFSSFSELARGASNTALSSGVLHRAVITPATRRLRSEAILDGAVEFPRIHPAREGSPHAFTWLVSGDLNAVIGIGPGGAWRWQGADDEAVSEAVFVPRRDDAGEDDGWLLTLVYAARRDVTGLAVLDARRLEEGPVARAWFDHGVPMTFHGSWLPAGE